jgi:hypothetical protein
MGMHASFPKMDRDIDINKQRSVKPEVNMAEEEEKGTGNWCVQDVLG